MTCRPDTPQTVDQVYEAITQLDEPGGEEAVRSLSKIPISFDYPSEHIISQEPPMKVLVFVKATPNSEAGLAPAR